MIDERTDRLITRRLDGELTEDESLDLDKRLIRSPETRRAFERSQQIDRLTVEVLQTLLNRKDSNLADGIAAGGLDAADGLPAAGRRAVRRGRWPTRRFLDGAIGVAAAVLLVLVSVRVLPQSTRESLPAVPGPDPGIRFAGPRPPSVAPGRPVPARAVEAPPVTELIAGPRSQQERIDQDIIGIVDPETQSVYLLEIQSASSRISRMRANY